MTDRVQEGYLIKPLSQKQVIVIGLSVGTALGIILAILLFYYGVLLSAASIAVAPQVLGSLVDADAALLGFLGILAVYALTALNDSIRLTEEQIYRVNLEHKQETTTNSSTGYSDIDLTMKALEKEYELFKNRIEKLEIRLKKIKKEPKIVCNLLVLGAIFFVTSILLSLLAMANVTDLVKFIGIYLAATFCIVGVMIIVLLVFRLGAHYD